MKNSQFPAARKSGLVIQEVPDEVLVFDLESNKAHCLNQTAAMVWRSCDGNTSVPEIAKFVEKQTGKTTGDELIWLALDQLTKNNLLESSVAAPMNVQTRREVIKKIGMASMVAIPIVASMVAPQSALANTSCTCTTGVNCFGQTGCPSETCCTAGACTGTPGAPGADCTTP